MSLFIVGVGRAARNESDSLVKASSERLKSHIREIGACSAVMCIWGTFW